MPIVSDVPEFHAGQREISARSLNKILAAARESQQDVNAQPMVYRARQILVETQEAIDAGTLGNVKIIGYDVDTSTFKEYSDAFEAFNLGPANAPAGARTPLTLGEGQIQFFNYYTSAVDQSSSSSSSQSSTSSENSPSSASEASSSSSSQSSASSSSSGVAPSDVPTGVILMFGSGATPAGYLVCDGSAVSETTYATLFGVIGYTYGNPGGGNFNLPNFVDKFARGNTAGTGGGADTHGHAVTGTVNNNGAVISDHGTQSIQEGTGASVNVVTQGNAAHVVSGHNHVFSGGSAASANNIPSYTGVVFIIKT